MMQRTVFSTLVLGLAAVLAGCASNGTAPTAAADVSAAASAPASHAADAAPNTAVAAEHAALIARSDAFWQARRTVNVAAAYALTSPGYRSVHSLEQFQLDYGAVPNLMGGDVVSVQCEQQRCVIQRSFTTTTPFTGATRVPISIDEIWVHQDGEWWRFIQ